MVLGIPWQCLRSRFLPASSIGSAFSARKVVHSAIVTLVGRPVETRGVHRRISPHCRLLGPRARFMAIAPYPVMGIPAAWRFCFRQSTCLYHSAFGSGGQLPFQPGYSWRLGSASKRTRQRPSRSFSFVSQPAPTDWFLRPIL